VQTTAGFALLLPLIGGGRRRADYSRREDDG
jgi:hypothetical protein